MAWGIGIQAGDSKCVVFFGILKAECIAFALTDKVHWSNGMFPFVQDFIYTFEREIGMDPSLPVP